MVEHINIFPAYLSFKKKKKEKIQIFDQNHGPTPLEKYQIFDFLNFVILESKNTFFLSRIIVKHIFLAYFA